MFIVEPERRIPVVAEADVLVIGGGSAGLPAALAAARAGADVFLVERFGYIGGQASGGLTITIPSDRQGVVTREMEQRLKEVGGIGIRKKGHMENQLVWCPELFKWMSVVMLEEANVRMLLYTSFVAPVLEGDAITGAIVENKGGRMAIKAKVVIDCTGDADVAAFAGAPCTKGDKDGKMLAPTMMCMLANIDETVVTGGTIGKLKVGKYNINTAMTEMYPGYANLWAGRIDDIDCTDPWQLTYAENESRKIAAQALFEARRTIPGCEKAFLSMTATQMGVRETRKITGEYWVTNEDWKSGRMFDDHIGYAFMEISLPYRCLVPQKIDNLLVGGRCISCEPNSARIVSPAMVTGWAAGAAAAVAAKRGVSPRSIDVGELQTELKRGGVPFTNDDAQAFCFGRPAWLD